MILVPSHGFDCHIEACTGIAHRKPNRILHARQLYGELA
jgi:hypothetical protein